MVIMRKEFVAALECLHKKAKWMSKARVLAIDLHSEHGNKHHYTRQYCSAYQVRTLDQCHGLYEHRQPPNSTFIIKGLAKMEASGRSRQLLGIWVSQPKRTDQETPNAP